MRYDVQLVKRSCLAVIAEDIEHYSRTRFFMRLSFEDVCRFFYGDCFIDTELNRLRYMLTWIGFNRQRYAYLTEFAKLIDWARIDEEDVDISGMRSITGVLDDPLSYRIIEDGLARPRDIIFAILNNLETKKSSVFYLHPPSGRKSLMMTFPLIMGSAVVQSNGMS